MLTYIVVEYYSYIKHIIYQISKTGLSVWDAKGFDAKRFLLTDGEFVLGLYPG